MKGLVTMAAGIDLRDALLDTWRTSNRLTVYLFENLPDELWAEKVPGAPRRTVRMIAGHIHNCRCMWIKTLGRKHGVTVPQGVDRHKVTRDQLIPALQRSSAGIIRLIEIGLDAGGKISGFPPDILHFTAYHVAHEAHHRGQIIMIARQVGKPLPKEVTTSGMWNWSKRAKEARTQT